MNLKYKLMILTAGILALTSSLLTALGMAELFQGLFIIFLVIDLGRFLVLNFVVDEWKNLRGIKWVITTILAILFVYSAVGVYNKLNSMIPESVQTAMIEAASYNRAQDNAEVKQNRSFNLAEIAQSEYQKSMDWNTKDHENCLKRANGNAEAENKCNNTKRRLDRSASNTLKEAMKNANTALDNTQEAINKNVKNQGEIAGVLTTVCKILPNTDCKTYDGLQMALTIIILLTICGLDYLQLSIVLAVNTRKNKKETEETSVKQETNEAKEEIILMDKKEPTTEFPKSIKKEKKKKKEKIEIKVEEPTKIENSEKTRTISSTLKQVVKVISEPKIFKKKQVVNPTKKEELKEDKSKISKNKKKPFTHETDFYK